ncbi:MAG: NUDIX domain-containing protein [Clostridia bacterium]|nr:NUDIX domain-containing protein [Clostridia bacterium]
MELWDLYDKNRKPLNKTRERCDPNDLNPGEYHIIVEVWTVDSRGRILLTLRDESKETYPGKWENTGGSALSGERSDVAAARELFEETGIEALPESLKLIYMRREKHAFLDTYIFRRDVDLSGIRLQPGETVDCKWVTMRELENMIANGFVARPVIDRLYDYRNVFERVVRQTANIK